MKRLSLACLLVVALSPAAAQTPAQPPTSATAAPDELAARARELAKQGSVFEALDAYGRAVEADPSQIDVRLEYARLLKDTGFWLRSADQYRAVLGLRPEHVGALIGYGELLNAEYQFSTAVERFSRALQVNPAPVERERALVGLGSALFGMEDYSAAAGTFAKVLEVRPDETSAMAFLAISKRKLGDLEGALEVWNKFQAIQPDSNRAQNYRIEVEAQIQAIANARAAAKDAPSDSHAWAGLGDLLRAKSDLSGARDAYTKASSLSPGDVGLRFSLGSVLRDSRRWSEAATVFAAIGRDPMYGTIALYNLAFCAKSAGDPTGESQAWRQAVALNRGDVYAYRHYVAALKRSRGLDLERAHVLEETQSARGSGDAIPFVRLGLIEQARGEAGAARDAALEAVRADCNDVRAQRLLHDLVGYDDIGAQELLQDSRLNAGATATPGERAEVHRTRGALLLATGRPTPAEEEFRKALSADERDVRTLVAIGSLVRSGGRLDEAITMLQAARTLGPDYLYAHLDLALALEDSGRADEALAAARAAVRLAPDDPLGYSSLGVILSAKGDVAKAAEAVERAVAIDPMDQIGAPRLLLAKLYGSMGRNARARTVLKGDLPQDPDEIYDMAWRFVGETYHDRTFKGQDWRLWKDRFTGRLKTVSDSLGAVALMLSSLDDRSTRLRSADQTATLLFTERSDTTEFAPSGVALSTSKTVDSRRLADNIGYIAITNMNDPKLPTDVQKAVEEMSKTDGVILDLRGNQGGADGDIERIAGMFVKPGTETGTVVTPQGTTKSTAEPTAGRTTPIIPESKPVVVLTDHNTASSAEHLVGSLKESKRAIVVGEKTHGKSAIQVPRLLPGGTVVLVVSSEHADLKGDVYTGVGIKPNVPMEGVSSGDRTDQDPAVKKARDLIKKKPDGGR